MLFKFKKTQETPKYWHWREFGHGRFHYSKVYPSGQVLMVSFESQKIEVKDEVKIVFSKWSMMKHNGERTACTKRKFHKALDLANKKVAYLARQDSFESEFL